MKTRTLRIILLAGALSIAASTINSTFAATTSMTSTTPTTTTTRTTKVSPDKDPTVLEIRQSIRSSNQEFAQQLKLLRSQMKGASGSEKASIRQEIAQLRKEHAAEIRQLHQSLNTEIRTIRQNNKANNTTA